MPGLQGLQWENLQRKDGFYLPVTIAGTNAQNSNNYGIVFIARYPMEVLRISEVHNVAGTDAGSVTLTVQKLTGTTAKGSGTSLLTTSFNLKSTANTPVDKEGTSLTSARQLVEHDRLCVVPTGTLTSLQDVQVTLYCKMLGRGDYR